MCFLDIFVNISGKIALENRENIPGENMAENVHNFGMDIVFLNIAHKIIIFYLMYRNKIGRWIIY